MKRKMWVSGIPALVFVLLLAVLCEKAVAQEASPPEDFDFVTEGNAVHIKGYKGTSPTPRIPSTIQGRRVIRILRGAFREKGLTGVTIPDSVTFIGAGAFHGNQLTNVTIPDSVTTIGDWAFAENQLTSVTIPDSVTAIGERAFHGNQLTNVTIGANVSLNQLPRISIGKIVSSGRDYSFSKDFDQFYNDNGKKAGTYTRPNVKSSEWSFTSR